MPDEPGITTPGEDLELASVHVDAGGDAPGSRSAQLKRLAEVAAAVSREPTLEGLLRTVTEGAREMVGAHQAVTSRLVRGWTEAITHVSLSDKYAAWRGYEQVPKGLGVLNAVTRTNRPIRLTPQELVRHPDYRALRDAPDHPPLPNYLAAPLVSRRGQNLGLIQLSDKATVDGAVGDFDADDEALIVTLAQLASAAIENLELVERERAAGERVDATARSLKLLSDAGEALAENLDLDATVRTVASLAVPLLGDWCGVHLAPGDDDATADADGAPPRLAAQAATDPQVGQVVARAAGALDVAAVLHQRGPRTFDRLPATMLADVERALPDRALGPGSACVVPLAARGRRIGTLTLVRVPGPAYAEGEVELASELARRAALAVDNAARYASERETALVLQRSMLPELQPRARGLLVASRYLPGASGVDVGGDWYDLIPLSDPSRHGLVVGDVAGRGVAAAAVMGQLRAVVRAYALEGHPPARLLTQLDRFVDAQGMTPFVTCLYAIVDEREHTLTVSSAGHLPPLVLDGDGARLLPVAPGPPLGTRYGGYRDETFELAPDATVLLYTDGLVEERSRSITEGLERLRQAARHWRSSPEALCDGVLGELGRLGHQEDDTALLAVNLAGREPAPAPPVRSSIEVPAQDTSAAAARRWLERALDGAGGEELVATAALLTTELVANAVRHGGGRWLEVALALDDAAVRVEVADAGAGAPRPQAPPDPGVDSGRGLMIVEALAQRWGYEPDASGRGKRVWFELDR